MRIKTLTIAALASAAVLTSCNSGSKKQNTDEWVIENDVWEYENIDFDDIAEVSQLCRMSQLRIFGFI